MLFNSYEFLLLFLPIVLVVFFMVGARNQHIATVWLLAASLFFYGWWNPIYVGLLIPSITFNFLAGRSLFVTGKGGFRRRWLLVAGIVANLAVLGYYKYINFFLSNIDTAAGTNWNVAHVVLPLGISFFTFTQIAFLVDAFKGEVKETNSIHYALFVTYFPHLIAGPILHHKEIMPQFAHSETYRPNYECIAMGLTIFAIGLFKKVMLADGVAVFVGPIFSLGHVAYVSQPTFLEAWGGALAYTLQIYFDFSGYSDMAIGLALMFGIRFPLNFNSPYKAQNIIDFWRRWHMTLSRFLRQYLYVPLGGNRKGASRRHVNLMITMLLGGLWHGAGWTFVIWGGLHGLFLIVNHAWRAMRRSLGQDPDRSTFPGRLLSWGITFFAVVVAWVFFRAENLESAMAILRGMAGMNGVMVLDTWSGKFGAASPLLKSWGVRFEPVRGFAGGVEVYWIVILLAIACLLPNSQQLFSRYRLAIDETSGRQSEAAWIRWSPNWFWAVFSAGLALVAIFNLSKVSEFIYFQF